MNEELVTIYDLEGYPMTMTKSEAHEYQQGMANCFKQLSQALTKRPDGVKGHVVVWGTTGGMDKTGYAEFLKELFYTPPEWHCKPIENIWADTNKRSLSYITWSFIQLRNLLKVFCLSLDETSAKMKRCFSNLTPLLTVIMSPIPSPTLVMAFTSSPNLAPYTLMHGARYFLVLLITISPTCIFTGFVFRY